MTIGDRVESEVAAPVAQRGDRWAVSQEAVQASTVYEGPSVRGRYSPQVKKTKQCQVDPPRGRRHRAQNQHPRELHDQTLKWTRWMER